MIERGIIPYYTKLLTSSFLVHVLTKVTISKADTLFFVLFEDDYSDDSKPLPLFTK